MCYRGNVGYYNRNTYDLLLEVNMSLTQGHENQTQNAGSMNNHGLELGLNFDIIKSNNFTWSLGGNFATVKNEVTEMNKDSEGRKEGEEEGKDEKGKLKCQN